MSSFSFFFCSSALFASALLGSSSANADAANDVMIAAITRVLMSISLPQGIRALPREGPTRLSGADSERCLPQAARAPGRNDGLHDDEQDLARFRRHAGSIPSATWRTISTLGLIGTMDKDRNAPHLRPPSNRDPARGGALRRLSDGDRK